MTYNIGQIVKNDKSETCIVLATKATPLTSDYLNSLDGEILIKGINEIAEKQVHVSSGFDYVIGRIKTFEGKYCTLENDILFASVFEDNIIQ